MTILQTGRSGGILTLYTESAAVREEWKTKLEEALGLRQVVQESNKVFEIETLNMNTFYMQDTFGQSPTWQDGQAISGTVTCSVPFSTQRTVIHYLAFTIVIATMDGRTLVAVGCLDGLWMGFRHDSRCECTCNERTLDLKLIRFKRCNASSILKG